MGRSPTRTQAHPRGLGFHFFPHCFLSSFLCEGLENNIQIPGQRCILLVSSKIYSNVLSLDVRSRPGHRRVKAGPENTLRVSTPSTDVVWVAGLSLLTGEIALKPADAPRRYRHTRSESREKTEHACPLLLPRCPSHPRGREVRRQHDAPGPPGPSRSPQAGARPQVPGLIRTPCCSETRKPSHTVLEAVQSWELNLKEARKVPLQLPGQRETGSPEDPLQR